MVARGGIGAAVLGGDVAGRTDREVHGAVGSDCDALQRVRSTRPQVGAARVGQAGRRRCADWLRSRWRSRRRRPDRSRRHRASSPANARPCGWSSPSSSTDCPGAAQCRHAAAQPARCSAPTPAGRRPGSTPRAAASETRAHTDIVQPVGHQGLSRFVERWLAPGLVGTVDGDRHEPRGCGRGGVDGVGGAGDGRGGDAVEHPASRGRRPEPMARCPLCRSQIRMHLPDQNLGRRRSR